MEYLHDRDLRLEGLDGLILILCATAEQLVSYFGNHSHSSLETDFIIAPLNL